MERYFKIKHASFEDAVKNCLIYKPRVGLFNTRFEPVNSPEVRKEVLQKVWSKFCVDDWNIPISIDDPLISTINGEQMINVIQDYFIPITQFREYNYDQYVIESVSLIKEWMRPYLSTSTHVTKKEYCDIVLSMFLRLIKNYSEIHIYSYLPWFRCIYNGVFSSNIHLIELKPPKDDDGDYMLDIVCTYPSKIIGRAGSIIESIRSIITAQLKYRYPEAHVCTNLTEFDPLKPRVSTPEM